MYCYDEFFVDDNEFKNSMNTMDETQIPKAFCKTAKEAEREARSFVKKSPKWNYIGFRENTRNIT